MKIISRLDDISSFFSALMKGEGFDTTMLGQNMDSTSEDDWLLPFRIVFVSMIVLGVVINFKLFRHVQKEKTGERGRVF